ncbi:MAG: MarR family winged helix-turn-helix transcriptional regulator [Acidimicrobiia bacterium]
MAHRSAVVSRIPDDEVVDAVMAASRGLVAVAARSIAQVDESLTLPQFRALVVLDLHGPSTVGALAAELGVHGSTVTRLCDRLVSRHLVGRATSPENRREVVVDLLPAGRDVVRRVTRARRRAVGAIVGEVPAEHRRSMVAALQAFADAAGHAPEPVWSAGWDLHG